MKFCKVCKFGKIFRGANFCEACITFYKRNRKRNDLVCKGDKNFRCPDDDVDGDDHLGPETSSHEQNNQESFNKLTKNGLLRRSLCPACRMEKYRKTVQQHRNSSSSTESQPNADLIPLTSSTTGNQEEMFNLVIGAADIFKGSLQTNRNWSSNFVNFSDAYKFYVEQFVLSAIKSIKQMVSNFSFYQNLGITERRIIFLNTRFTPLCCEGLLHGDICHVAALSSSTFYENVAICPERVKKCCLEVFEQAEKSWHFFRQFNFTNEEIAFIFVLSFFDGNFFSTFDSIFPLFFFF